LAGLAFFCYFSDSVNANLQHVVYEFGLFRLEPGEHRLVRKGHAIPLTGKAFDTLCALLERHGKLIPKQELMDAVWLLCRIRHSSHNVECRTMPHGCCQSCPYCIERHFVRHN
jgi:hypothetical protein